MVVMVNIGEGICRPLRLEYRWVGFVKDPRQKATVASYFECFWSVSKSVSRSV